MDQGKMADRIARTVIGGKWEIKKVSPGGVWFRVNYDFGVRMMKFVDIAKEVREMGEWVKMDLLRMEHEGMKLNMASVVIGDAMVMMVEGKIGVYADVMVNGMAGVRFTHDDVEEQMMEAGN